MVFKMFKMSAIFKMAAKTWHKKLAVKIQHCPISKFDMWVDNDVPTLKIVYRSPIFKMAVKTQGKTGDVWETFHNSILLLSYLVILFFFTGMN